MDNEKYDRVNRLITFDEIIARLEAEPFPSNEIITFENTRISDKDYAKLFGLNLSIISTDYEDDTLVAKLELNIHDNIDFGKRYLYRKDYNEAHDNYFNKKKKK